MFFITHYMRRHRGRDGEIEGQRTAVVGAEDEQRPTAGKRGCDAGNCIRVTGKRRSMASACLCAKKNNAVFKRHCSELC